MFQPLTGIRVVDLSQVLAGPYATYQLALLGAEVIKIEKPGAGDWTRAGAGLPGLEGAGMGTGFLTQNAGKRSVALDLKHPAGLEIAERLVGTADIFVENLRPGKAAGLGLSFERVKALKPGIVYCSISAFGQDGPIGHRGAYDHVVQGMSGIMRTTGTASSGPTKVGAPYIDYSTGLNAAFAIVSALHETRRTGEAVHVDVAMLDTAMLLMANLMTRNLSEGWVPAPSGNAAWSGSPSSGAFETADGILMVAANTDDQFRALTAAAERPEWLDDPRWNEPSVRAENAESLRDALAARFRDETADHWEQTLDGAGVPAARIRGIDEVLAEAQLSQRGIAVAQSVPGAEVPAHVPSLGFKADGAVVAPAAPPPRLGADTEAVLAELGFTDNDIAHLKDTGAI
jgi:formyl-CoA transferase